MKSSNRVRCGTKQGWVSDPTGLGRTVGYTMVEVLVVVAILGLLVGVAVPMSLRMKANAQSTNCVSNLRNIGIGLSTYFLDHGTTFPVLVSARESKSEDEPSIDQVLLPYVIDEFTFRCPADHEGLFEETGTSYFWNSLVNGQKFGNMDLLGLIDKPGGIPIVSDKENFHEDVGDGVNILYADGHVKREIQFSVEPR